MPFSLNFSLIPVLMFVLLSLSINTSSANNDQTPLSFIKDQAIELQLSHTPTWRKLLHFNNKGVSYIDDERFFLSPDGKHNLQSELLATIEQLIISPALQCQYPLRTQWLKANIPSLTALIPITACPEYSQWRKRLNAHSVTLVLASSFLNSPSSMYGHTFLRFDTQGSEKGKDLTSYAVNFGATITDGGGIMYAYNGLFGGYPGYFSDGPYYEKVKEYSRFDNRDVWEYRLNFTPEETDKILAHLWELNGIRFDYYFFDENCSYRLLELLEVGRENIEIASEFDLFAIPIDTIRVTEQAHLIETVVYRASNRSKLVHNMHQLSKDEKQLVHKLVQSSSNWKQYDVDQLPESRQYKIAEVAYQLIRYQNNRKARNQKLAQDSLFLLRKMREYAQFASAEAPPIPTRPETGHDTQTVSISAGYQDAPFLDLEVRAAYHDVLDNLKGYPLATSLNMGSLKVRYLSEPDKIQLQSFNIVEIASINPRDQFFKPISWRINAGLDREWTLGDEKLAGIFDGGAGLTAPLFLGIDGFVFAQARVEYNAAFDHNLDVAAGLSSGLLFQNDLSSFIFEAKQYHFAQGFDRKKISLGYQLPLGKNNGIRLNLKKIHNDKDKINESSISYRHYF